MEQLNLKKSVRRITKIILHCTATVEGKDYSVDTIRQWHTTPKPIGNGWDDIAYHYIIYRDGTIHEGRDVNIKGAHTKNQNANSIGIVYIGGIDTKGNPKDTRTDAQKQSLFELVRRLMAMYNIDVNCVFGHYHFANKACPSFNVEQFRKKL